MSILSKRVLSIDESPTSGMSAKARELKSQGADVINLSQGEPDFKTPRYISEAAKIAIDSGKYFSYPPTAGYRDLREAIAIKYRKENKIPYEFDNIVISNGAKQALSNAMLSILNRGDEVIIFAPYWVSYLAQVKLADATPIIIKGKVEYEFKINVEQIKASISGKTKAIIFSSPCNPTGAVYTREELEEIAKLVLQYPDLLVIADEIYEHINYTPDRVSFASLPGMFERTITINGFGKCYAMTGWRVGYLAAPKWIAKEVAKIQGHLSSSNCSIAQRAALAAITGSLGSLNEMVKEYRERRDIAYSQLLTIPNIHISLPEGAFYFFPDIRYYYGLWHKGKQIKNSVDMCTYLLGSAHVALVPGSAFGDDACVRISYAASKPDLLEALNRIKLALSNLKVEAPKEILSF